MSRAAEGRAGAGGAAATIDVDQALSLYRQMVLIRGVEVEIETLHKRGRMTGSFHSSMGQEACAAGVCAALRQSDIVTSNHRGHGHAVAKGIPIEGIFAELFGRSTGVSGGRGGSMHLHHRESGFLGENAIVAGGLPWAGGAAWARKKRGLTDVGVAFIGDGGFAQGVTHEVLLMARYWEAPLVIVCENNGLAHSMASERLFGEPGSITRIVEATGVRSEFVDGRDVIAVAETAAAMVEHARTVGPAFIECQVFRVKPHSLSDPDYRYREKDAGQAWLETHDPILALRRRLGEDQGEALDRIDAEVAEEVAAASAAAEAAPQTPVEAALENVYLTAELNKNG
ncbi:MAG: thiamine pyrophosphate-dependent dehydrogenase E1 component subunit alpha [Actinobacteria bacterium]|nr:thiamine pyrophosphate-dependent dehydrogenase E1 component subunit alpha [Actinomycetota bacterium]